MNFTEGNNLVLGIAGDLDEAKKLSPFFNNRFLGLAGGPGLPEGFVNAPEGGDDPSSVGRVKRLAIGKDVLPGRTMPVKGPHIKKIEGDRMAVLLDDGSVLVEHGSPGKLGVPEGMPDIKVKKISVGRTHLLILSEGGEAFSMDMDEGTGRLGNPVKISGDHKIKKIRAGDSLSLLLNEENELWKHGGLDSVYPTRTADLSHSLRSVLKMFAGPNSKTVFALRENKHVVVVGRNDNKQSGVEDPNKRGGPPMMFGAPRIMAPGKLIRGWRDVTLNGKEKIRGESVKKMMCSGNASFLLTEDGSLFSCGAAQENGFTSTKETFEKHPIFSESGSRVLDFSCGKSVSVFLTESGRVYLMGSGSSFEKFGEATRRGDEVFWEIGWYAEGEQTHFQKMVSLGFEFKVSVWRSDAVFILQSDKNTKETIRKLDARINEKMRKLKRILNRGIRKAPEEESSESEPDEELGTVEISRLNEVIENLDEANESLRTENGNLKRGLEDMKEKVENLKNEIGDAKSENEALKKKIEDMSEKIKDMEEERKRMEKEINDLVNKNGKLETEASNLRQRNKELKRKYQKMLEEHEEIREKVEKTLKCSEGMWLIKMFYDTLMTSDDVLERFDFLSSGALEKREMKKAAEVLFRGKKPKYRRDIFQMYRMYLKEKPSKLKSLPKNVIATLERISDVFELSRILGSSLRAYGKRNSNARSAGNLEKIDKVFKVYEKFFECIDREQEVLDSDAEEETINDISDALALIFDHLDISGFDMDSLIVEIGSLEDDLRMNIDKLEREISKRPAGRESVGHSKPRPFFGCGEVDVSEYFKRLESKSSFLKKVEFLTLVTANNFISSVNKEVEEAKEILERVTNRVREFNWERMRPATRPRAEAGPYSEILEELKSRYQALEEYREKHPEDIQQNTPRRTYESTMQREAVKTLVKLLSISLEGEVSEERISSELVDVYRYLKITDEDSLLNMEDVENALYSGFDVDLSYLVSELAEADKSFEEEEKDIVVAFKKVAVSSGDPDEYEVLYNAMGGLVPRYNDGLGPGHKGYPEVKGLHEYPLTIIINDTVVGAGSAEKMDIRFVHLLTGYKSTPVYIRKKVNENLFEVTVDSLKYCGEYAVIVRVPVDDERREDKVFARRNIFIKRSESLQEENLE